MDAISVVADTFNFLIVGLGTILNNFFQINFAIVTSLITSIASMQEALLDQVFPILNILKCYYEDFLIFLIELFSVARCIFSVISYSLHKLFTGLSNMAFLFRELGYIIHQNVTSVLTFVHSCVLRLHENIAYLMQLIFKSLLLILELGPNLVIFFYNVALYCVCYLGGTVEEGLEAFIINLYGLCSMSKKVVFSIPVKAYLGILLFITIFYHYKVIVIYLKAYFLLLFLFFVHLGKQISHFIYICAKPVITTIMIVFSKIKSIFMPNEEISITDETDANRFEEGSVRKNLFKLCVQKVKTSFSKYYFKKKYHTDEEVKKLQQELTAEREKHLCIICFDKPRTIILYPCRHMCICEECCLALHAELQGCPLCRRDVQNVFHVFT